MNECDVANYLVAHPEFFDRHAELLSTITLANPHGNRAVSLPERQMRMLRDKNRQSERRFAELLRYGHENDSLISKLNRWTARILAERDPHALPCAVTDGLREIFNVPAALRLWRVAKPYRSAEYAREVGEEIRLFAQNLSKPYCGVNKDFEAAQWLTLPAAASVALVALHDPQYEQPASPFGLLVMGSTDPRRFEADMATDFLTYLSVLASAALSRLLMP